MPVKSFRGQLLDGTQERINLHTNKGKIGYIIKKFKIIDSEPGEIEVEIVAKIYSVEQSSIDNTVDFSKSTLIAQAFYANQGNQSVVSSEVIIIDNSIFNQDIYVTVSSLEGTPLVNYYIEAEQVPLTDDEALVTTLKNIRNNA